MKTKSSWKLAALAIVAVAGAALMVPSVNAEPAKPGSKSEGRAATKLTIGQPAPTFKLKDTTGKEFDLAALTKEGKIVVLEWFNSECPFCVKHGEAKTVVSLVNEFSGKNVVVLGINSGAPGKQGHGKDAEAIKAWGLNYPILIDESGEVGRMFGAKTTPHMFIINKDGALAYQGAIDSNPGRDMGDSAKVTNYVRKALNEMLKGETVSEPETKPYGCSVKYAS